MTGPGAASPVQVVATPRRREEVGALGRRLRRALAADPEIARAAAPAVSRDGRSVLLAAEPRSEGESPAAKATVAGLRHTLPQAAGAGVALDVGGPSARQRDLNELVSGSLWYLPAPLARLLPRTELESLAPQPAG